MHKPIETYVEDQSLFDPCHTPLTQAQRAAMLAADAYGIPQTVFRDQDSAGWWHTNSLANRLRKADQAVTFLPANYYS